MYLKRLEIQGFKSFAKRTILEFDKGITAIVGPNGSGKSNAADCLRWVLGEQSIKAIRGKKSEDVIFAGSDSKARGGLAEVFATFDNRDKKIPIDSAEVSLGRRIDRSGESEYLINGNKVRLLDIVDLVLKSNIGTSRYTVIGQGTIDNFILQGPSGVKELIDEASGVKTYYIRRERTLRRLEQTAANLMRAEDIIAEIEPRLKSLRRLAKKMEARAEIEAELKNLQVKFFSSEYNKNNKELSELRVGLDNLGSVRRTTESEIENLMVGVTESDKQQAGQLEELSGVRQKIESLQHEKNKLLEHLSLLRGKIESLKGGAAGDPESIRANLHSLESKLTGDLQEFHKVVATETTAASNLSEATNKLNEVNRRLEEIYKELSNPHEVNFLKISEDLSNLELSFNAFLQVIETSGDLEEVRQSARGFRESFVSFSKVTTGELKNPKLTVGKLQGKLQSMLAEKEHIQNVLSAISIEVSKASVSREFLEKQIESYEHEKKRLSLELSGATSSSGDFLEQIAKEEEKIEQDLTQLESTIGTLQSQMQMFYTEEKQLREQKLSKDNIIRQKQAELTHQRDLETGAQVAFTRQETIMEALFRDIYSALGNEGLEIVKNLKVDISDPDLLNKIEKLKHQLEMVGGVDELTIREHSETEIRFSHLTSQVDDLKKATTDLRQVMDELDEHITTSFNQAFHKINEKFEYYFRVLFNGGRAHLVLVRDEPDSPPPGEEGLGEVETSEDKETLRPEEKLVRKYEQRNSGVSGIDIKATPPGKKLSSIQALSGGERALTSIALLCSMLASFPSPFVMLDEVDAALDETNTIRFGQILGTLSHQTQFITITHNRETMNQANTIYGVTMGDDGVSKLLSIKFDQAAVYVK